MGTNTWWQEGSTAFLLTWDLGGKHLSRGRLGPWLDCFWKVTDHGMLTWPAGWNEEESALRKQVSGVVSLKAIIPCPYPHSLSLLYGCQEVRISGFLLSSSIRFWLIATGEKLLKPWAKVHLVSFKLFLFRVCYKDEESGKDRAGAWLKIALWIFRRSVWWRPSQGQNQIQGSFVLGLVVDWEIAHKSIAKNPNL